MKKLILIRNETDLNLKQFKRINHSLGFKEKTWLELKTKF